MLPSGNTGNELAAKFFQATRAYVEQDTAFLRERPPADRVDMEGWLQVRGMMQQPLVTDREVLAVIHSALIHFSDSDSWNEPNYPIPIRADQGRIRNERVWVIQYCRGIRHPNSSWTLFPKDTIVLIVGARFPNRILGETTTPTTLLR
jgi:hypothetical protein